jgi:hypothetical protein
MYIACLKVRHIRTGADYCVPPIFTELQKGTTTVIGIGIGYLNEVFRVSRVSCRMLANLIYAATRGLVDIEQIEQQLAAELGPFKG